jgi:hypothetical protein
MLENLICKLTEIKQGKNAIFCVINDTYFVFIIIYLKYI